MAGLQSGNNINGAVSIDFLETAPSALKII